MSNFCDDSPNRDTDCCKHFQGSGLEEYEQQHQAKKKGPSSMTGMKEENGPGLTTQPTSRQGRPLSDATKSRANQTFTYSHVPSNLKFRVGLSRVYLKGYLSARAWNENKPNTSFSWNGADRLSWERTCSDKGQSSGWTSSQNNLRVGRY